LNEFAPPRQLNRYVAFSVARTTLMKGLLTIAACCLLLMAAKSSSAKSWHGIVPLHSARDDVHRLLGKPTHPGDLFEGYDFRGYSLSVLYATENVLDPTETCDSPLRYWWGYYHVSVGTVLSVTVSYDNEILLTKFKIPNFKKLTKGEPDDTLSVDYFDAARGIQYSVREGNLHTIEYGPSAVADAALRCAPDPEADFSETRVRQMCQQRFGPTIDQRMGLYTVNASYVLSLTFDRHGDLVAVHVEPKHFYDWYNVAWEEPNDFRNLSKAEYERILAQIDQIKPRGPLVQPVTTNLSGWREEQYRDGVLEWDEVRKPSTLDPSGVVRRFTVFYVKRR
jgi:hypothetical protein